MRAAEAVIAIDEMTTGVPQARRLIRASLWIVALTVGSKFLGLFREGVLAWAFGTTGVVDAFRVAQTGIFLLIHVLAGSPIESAFLPTFKHLLSSGRARLAWSVVRVSAVGLAIAGAVLALALLAGGDLAARLLAPGFDPERLAWTAMLLRAMAVAVPLGLLANLFMTVSGGLYRFRVPALRAPVQNLAVLLGIFAALGFGSIIVLGLALPLAQAAFLLLLVFSLRGVRRPRPRGTPARDRMAWNVLGVALLPGFGIVLLEQAHLVVERIVASHLSEGSVASLDYARFLVETPLVTVGIGTAQVFLPAMSDLAAAGQTDRFERSARVLLLASLWALLPISAWLAVSGEDLVRIVYARGAFGEPSVRMTSAALLGFTAGLWAWFGGIVILQKLLYAQRRLRALLPLTAAVLLSFVLVALALAPRFGVFGVALAFSISQVFFFAGALALQGRALVAGVLPVLVYYLAGAIGIALLARGFLPAAGPVGSVLLSAAGILVGWLLWTLPVPGARRPPAELYHRIRGR